MIKQVPQYIMTVSANGKTEPVIVKSTMEQLVDTAHDLFGFAKCSLSVGCTVARADGDFSIIYIPPIASITQCKSAVKRYRKKENIQFVDSVISDDGLYRTIEWKNESNELRTSIIRMNDELKAVETSVC